MKKIMFNDRYGLTQAVLDGRKTMTRRLINLCENDLHFMKISDRGEYLFCSKTALYGAFPRYKVGEILAVAQSYYELNKSGYVAPEWLEHTCESSAGYKNKMFVRADLMPHRIRITNIKVERLQDISHEDCLKEGILYQDGYFCGYKVSAPNMAFGAMTAQQAFAALIDKVSGEGTWDSNPYVFVYEFELMKGMIIHKQHTDPDQSERLIKAGLDIGTADMHYRDGVYHQGKPDMNTMAVVAPIWSAYALRKLIPTKIRKDLDGTKISYRIGWEPTQQGFVVFYVDSWWHSFTLVEFECEDLNDGYIDMMCWLLDNGYVEKKGGEQ